MIFAVVKQLKQLQSLSKTFHIKVSICSQLHPDLRDYFLKDVDNATVHNHTSQPRFLKSLLITSNKADSAQISKVRDKMQVNRYEFSVCGKFEEHTFIIVR